MIQSVRTTTKRKRKDSGDDDNSNDAFGYNAYDNSRDPTSGEGPQVDLGILQVKTLRRYQKLHRIQARQGNNKSALVEVCPKIDCCIPISKHYLFLPLAASNASLPNVARHRKRSHHVLHLHGQDEQKQIRPNQGQRAAHRGPVS